MLSWLTLRPVPLSLPARAFRRVVLPGGGWPQQQRQAPRLDRPAEAAQDVDPLLGAAHDVQLLQHALRNPECHSAAAGP